MFGIEIRIGRNCTIRNAILDLDSRIGDGVKLINAKGIDEAEEEQFAIRGGVIVVPRAMVWMAVAASGSCLRRRYYGTEEGPGCASGQTRSRAWRNSGA